MHLKADLKIRKLIDIDQQILQDVFFKQKTLFYCSNKVALPN